VLAYYLVCARFAKPISTQELDGLFQKQIAFRTAVAIESVFIFEDDAVNGISRHRRIQTPIFTCLSYASPSHDQTEVIGLATMFLCATMNMNIVKRI
jgi:hypothetical protein